MNEAIIAAIRNAPDATDAEVAQAVNERPDRYQSTTVTPEGLVARVGPEVAARVLGGLKAVAESDPLLAVLYQRLLTSAVGLDIGDAAGRGVLMQLAGAGAISEPDAAAVIALADAGNVTAEDVAQVRGEQERQAAADSYTAAARDAYNAAIAAAESYVAGDVDVLPAA